MENQRTETARDHDDYKTIDAVEKGTDQQGSAGGNLARDVASRSDGERITDPDNHERVTKQDDIDNDVALRSDRPRTE